MKTKIQNFCPVIRASMAKNKLSTVKVLNACNSALGELDKSGTKSTLKQGAARVTKTAFKISEAETITDTFTGDSSSVPLRFVAWQAAIEKAEKIASFNYVEIPKTFLEWMQFAKVVESEEQPAEEKLNETEQAEA